MADMLAWVSIGLGGLSVAIAVLAVILTIVLSKKSSKQMKAIANLDFDEKAAMMAFYAELNVLERFKWDLSALTHVAEWVENSKLKKVIKTVDDFVALRKPGATGDELKTIKEIEDLTAELEAKVKMKTGYRNRDMRVARYRVGAWAFILHRISGVVIALYGITHVLVISTALRGEDGFNRLMEAFQKPWVLALEMALIAAILFHMLNGLRIVLFDLGVGIRRQKQLFWGLVAVGAVALLLTVLVTLPWLQGRELS